MTPSDESIVRAQVLHLCQSERGRQVATDLLSLMRDGVWLSLDQMNQRCLISLLVRAWGSSPGTVMDGLAEALDQPRS